MTKITKKETINSARDKFLGSSLESSRKSYYPQLLEQLEGAKNNEKRLQLLIDNLPARIAYVNAEQVYILVNSEYEKVFKKKKEEIIGNSLKDLLGEENYKNIHSYVQQALNGNEVHFEISVMIPHGEAQWNEISYIPVFDVSNHVEGFYLLARDLSGKKRSEEEKRKLEVKLYETEKFKTMGTLAAGVAHDFNNLLMGIQGHSSLLEVKFDPSDPLMTHVRAINEHIESATSLTKQLLGLTRGGKYEVKPIDINRLVVDYSKMFSRTRKEITIYHNLAKETLAVEADRNQIEQVLLNLLINAWQAMPEGGDIYLETRTIVLDEIDCLAYEIRPGFYVTLSVTDSGVGMTREVQQQVFDPFFTTKEKMRGTGLGLASAYGIVRNHGGIIKVYSEVNQGTTFSIHLPLSTETVLDEKRAENSYLKGTATILLVDDEEIVLEVGRAMLETLGYTVLIACNGQDAVRSVSEDSDAIGLVVLDMIMPGMNGGETFDCIREINPRLPVILSSGYSRNGQAERIIQRGCDGFLQKPFNISELSLKIGEILERRT